MRKIKKFNEVSGWETDALYGKSNSSEITNQEEEFVTHRNDVIEKITSLMIAYEKFSKMVSPKNWRSTGHHFTELRNMKDDIEKFSALTEKEKEMNWVKNQL